MAILGRISVGQLTVIEDDRETVFGSGAPQATVHVHDPRVWSQILRGGRGMGETYMDGLWDTPDLTAVIRVAARNVGAHRRHPPPPLPRARAVPARPRRVQAQHAAPQPQGHRRPLRPRQRAVRADARPHADVLVRRLRAPRRDARGGVAGEARDGVREARARAARPRRRDRHRLGRVRGLRRDDARLPRDDHDDLARAARLRRAARARGRASSTWSSCGSTTTATCAAPTTSSSRSR